jgi:phage antirepressor YoqD-like protein
MTPKVEALTRIALADGSMCIQSAAQHLQIQPKKLFLWLSEHEWIYRRAGGTGWLGYQSRIQSGLLEHKVTTVERSDGSEKMVEQCRITPRGLSKLAELLNEKEAA